MGRKKTARTFVEVKETGPKMIHKRNYEKRNHPKITTFKNKPYPLPSS